MSQNGQAPPSATRSVGQSTNVGSNVPLRTSSKVTNSYYNPVIKTNPGKDDIIEKPTPSKEEVQKSKDILSRAAQMISNKKSGNKVIPTKGGDGSPTPLRM